MIQVINSIFFSFAILFGIEAPIFSEYSNCTIDLDKQTIEIEYINLQTQGQYFEQVSLLINSIDSIDKLHPHYNGLNLLSKVKSKVNGQTSYLIKMEYDSLTTLNEYFNIDLNKKEIMIFPSETIIVNNLDTLNCESEFSEFKPIEVRRINTFHYIRKNNELFKNMKNI